MKKTYLIDSENINEVWVEILSALHDGDEILVFYTDKSAHMSYDKIIRLIEQEVGTVRWIKCFGGQNALDFQLVTELGYCLNQAADREYIIVSNDMGYDAAVRYWKLRGCKVSRIRGSECEKLAVRQQKEEPEAAASGRAAVEAEEPEQAAQMVPPAEAAPAESAKLGTEPTEEASAEKAEEHVPSKPAARRRKSVRRRLSEMLDQQTAPARPAEPEAEPVSSVEQMESVSSSVPAEPKEEPAAVEICSADAEICSVDAGQFQQGVGRAREIVLEDEPYRIVLHTYGSEQWMPEPQQEAEVRSQTDQWQPQPTVQEPGQQPDVQEPEMQSGPIEQRQAQEDVPEPQPAADDWASRLKQVFHECGSRDPETDLVFLTSLCKTVRMSNMSVMHNVLEYQFGQKTGNGIYRFLKENPGCRSYLSSGYSNSKKQREREYLQLVLSRNEMNPADTDGILRIINALPRKNLNAIHVSLVKRFGQEKGGAVYTVIRSHVKIIRGL